jgi:fluoride exporter
VAGDRWLGTAEPVDPDIGAWVAGQQGSRGGLVLAAVTLGGMIGAAGRYAAGVWWPDSAAGFPWTTFALNLLGSGLLGVVAVLAAHRWPGRPLLRPLLATGLLGGFTTFSTFAVDTQRLIIGGHALIAAAYVAATLAACGTVTWITARTARALLLRSGG